MAQIHGWFLEEVETSENVSVSVGTMENLKGKRYGIVSLETKMSVTLQCRVRPGSAIAGYPVDGNKTLTVNARRGDTIDFDAPDTTNHVSGASEPGKWHRLDPVFQGYDDETFGTQIWEVEYVASGIETKRLYWFGKMTEGLFRDSQHVDPIPIESSTGTEF